MLVNQCATRIARIDRSVGLDRLVCHHSVIGTHTWAYRTVQGADDALGDGALQPKWRSHRHYRLTDTQTCGGAGGDRSEARQLAGRTTAMSLCASAATTSNRAV